MLSRVLIGLVIFLSATGAHAQVHLVATNYQSMNEAALKIGEFGRALRAQGDRRSLFPNVYAITIASTARRIEEFHNRVWVTQLVLNYANLYRRTILTETTGHRRQLPLAWQLTFDTEQTQHWTPDLDLAFGINVHVARDLVDALLVTPTDYADESVHRDFLHITDVLRDAMTEIWPLFQSYGSDIQLPTSLEQSVMMKWIAAMRAEAWYNGKALSTASAAEKTAALHAIDVRITAAARAHGVLLALPPY